MSRVLGIGTDIVYLPRFARLISKYGKNSSSASLTKLTSKFMSEHEQKKVLGMMVKGHSTGNNDSIVRYAAGIWAAKEATYKALCSYVPAAAMPPAKTIYTKLLNKTNSETGTPMLELSSDFIEIHPEYSVFYKSYIQEHCKVFISISHDHDYLISYVQITN
ncbi:hypothetical protein KAFR_0H02480 [Kazachstania africana CBS 2517]|uniref:4'-phosphopantetheinyl transferase domain-containing protein n=1 Tax=Kazachstania africana (strain ATCC 22294 / BCRC 22015 / CBS 2517 / CECT 1963 / NBRC 1671 / NRRL Y-8276) TaxID=1071382 RepID=H2AZA1_KAZAF|nr:hypothetical protein KAFR_0H02480 [Kazachstania africana CBS 2517]CCF59657.1 hypothetical protein KAFR_0H02480 [Kazachstania africana CBS 2517]